MLNKDVGVTIIVARKLFGYGVAARTNCKASSQIEMAAILGVQFPVSHAPKRPHHGFPASGFWAGQFRRRAWGEEESDGSRAGNEHSVHCTSGGLTIGNCAISHSRSGGEDDGSIKLDMAVDANAADRVQLALQSDNFKRQLWRCGCAFRANGWEQHGCRR